MKKKDFLRHLQLPFTQALILALSILIMIGSRWAKELMDAAKPYIGNSQIVDFQVHGWRYSKPISVDDSESLLITQSSQLPPIAVAGDAFAGPRFEGAVVSGWSAAKP